MTKQTMLNRILMGALAVIVVLGVGSYAIAENDSPLSEIKSIIEMTNGNAEVALAGFNYLNSLNNPVMGAVSFITSATSLTDLDITNDLRVQGDTEFQGNMDFTGSSGVTITGTTTPAVNTYFPINPIMTHPATSTIKGTSTQWLVMGYYLNTGDDLIIDDVYMEETVAPALYQFDVRVGTTTPLIAGTTCGTDGLCSWANTSTDTLTASTTVTTTWTTEINGFIDTNTYAGTYYNPISNEGRPTTTQVLLKHGEAILWSWLSTKSTSTASNTVTGGFNAVANAGARARLR